MILKCTLKTQAGNNYFRIKKTFQQIRVSFQEATNHFFFTMHFYAMQTFRNSFDTLFNFIWKLHIPVLAIHFYTMHNLSSLDIPCNGVSTLSPVASSSGKTFFAFLFFSFSLSFSFFFPFLVIIFTLKLEAFDLSFLFLGRFL